jgi:hypothetical protein
MQTSKLKKALFSELTVPVLAASLLLGATATTQAAIQPVTFAQAIESSTNADSNVFAYNDNGPKGDAEFGTSVGGVLGAPVPMEFSFLAGAGISFADLTGIQDATISMTSSTTAVATPAFGGTFAEQPINGQGAVINQIKFTRDTPALEGSGTRTNLLTVTFTGNLAGSIGGTTPSLFADTATGDTVTYSSDFVSFAQSTQQDFNLALSSWDPLITPPTGLSVSNDGNFSSASAALAATFDFQLGSTVLPEPSASSALVFAGLILLPGMSRKLRTR